MDVNTLAYKIVRQTTDEESDGVRKKRSGRSGGLIGGAERAKVLTETRRKEIAAHANRIRWAKS